MRKTLITLLLLLPSIAFTGSIPQIEEYEPKGPDETVSFEKALRKSLGGYVTGIWPRENIINDAIRGEQLPDEYVKRLKKWITLIVNKNYLPENLDPNEWYGIKKLHFNQNYIIGQFSKLKQDFTNRIDKVLEIIPKGAMGSVLGYTHLFSGKMARRDDLFGDMAYMVDLHEAIHTIDEYETRVLTSWMLEKTKPKYKF